MAQADNKVNDQFTAGLCIEGGSGRKAIPILSSRTHVSLLADLCLQVTLKQKFKIPKHSESGVSYIFPLPAKAAVHKFEAKLASGSVIKGLVKKKEQARAQYKAAVDQGFRALLMEQEDADVFKVSVGSFSNETCEVTMSFVMEIEVTPQDVSKGGIRFTLPQDIAPRFDATYSGAAAPYHIQIVLDAHCSSKITTLEVTENYKRFLRANLEGTYATAVIDAPPKSFGNIVGLPGAVEFYLTQESIPLVSAMVERCVEHQSEVLRVSFDEKFSKTTMERDGYVCPTLELSFLIDRSGSMSGLNMRMVKDAMAVFLRSLPSNCLLQLIEFQSSFSNCFERGPKPYSQATLDAAEKWVNNLYGSGGTEIKPALASVLEREDSTGFMRHVILLTDGDVGNVDAIVSMVKTHRHARVHTLGLGKSFSEGLCLKVAEASNGCYEACRDAKDLSSTCIRLLRAVQLPNLTDVKFNLGKWNAENEAEMFPKDFRLIPGKRQNVYFVKSISAEGAKETIEVEQFGLSISAKAFSSETGFQSVELCSIQANSSPVAIEGHQDVAKSSGLMLHRMMAKSRIDAKDPDSINIGIKFNLVSPGTSFIAVEYKEGKQTDLTFQTNGEETEDTVIIHPITSDKTCGAARFHGRRSSRKSSRKSSNNMFRRQSTSRRNMSRRRSSSHRNSRRQSCRKSVTSYSTLFEGGNTLKRSSSSYGMKAKMKSESLRRQNSWSFKAPPIWETTYGMKGLSPYSSTSLYEDSGIQSVSCLNDPAISSAMKSRSNKKKKSRSHYAKTKAIPYNPMIPPGSSYPLIPAIPSMIQQPPQRQPSWNPQCQQPMIANMNSGHSEIMTGEASSACEPLSAKPKDPGQRRSITSSMATPFVAIGSGSYKVASWVGNTIGSIFSSKKSGSKAATKSESKAADLLEEEVADFLEESSSLSISVSISEVREEESSSYALKRTRSKPPTKGLKRKKRKKKSVTEEESSSFASRRKRAKPPTKGLKREKKKSKNMKPKKGIKQPTSRLTFTELIRCQKFDGRFVLDLDAFSAQKTIIKKLSDLGVSTVALDTVLALYILHSEYLSQRDEWELVAEKAETFLKTQNISNSILENIDTPDLW